MNTYKLHFASDDKISTLDKKSMFFFFSAKHVIATYLKYLYGVLPMSAHVLWRNRKNIDTFSVKKYISSRKLAYIILTPLNPTFGGGRVVRRCCVSYITGASN